MTAGLFRREVERAIAAILSTGRTTSEFSFSKSDWTCDDPAAFIMTVSRGAQSKGYVSDGVDWLATFLPELTAGHFDDSLLG